MQLASLLALIFAAILSSCAPAPPGVPRNASTQWTLKGSFHWEWTRELSHGCASWSAKDTYASVHLSTDPANCEDGPGVWYFTVFDYLVFKNYWPWSTSDYIALMSYDSEGSIETIAPCPHSLAAEQLSAMRIVADEALAAATTDAERRTAARIVERLASTNGNALQSSQTGCTDQPANWYSDDTTIRHDTWRNRETRPRRPPAN